jgi:cysteine-rich repeat protein
VCGDGMTLGAESSFSHFCDDGNRTDGDGCSAECTIECGYECHGGTATGVNTCHTSCGDGELAGNETCDDGNDVDGDGCSADCSTVEHGWGCSHLACGGSDGSDGRRSACTCTAGYSGPHAGKRTACAPLASAARRRSA